MSMTVWIWKIAAGVFVVLSCIYISAGDLEPILQRCCLSGDAWARNHSTCVGPTQELTSVPPQDRLTCLTSLYVCCVRRHRKISCERGKEVAKQGRLCSSLQTSDHFVRDCCDGCSLGIQAGVMRMSCGFQQFSFGAPWDEAYIDCCENVNSNQGTSQLQRQRTCDAKNPCAQKCEVISENRIVCSCYPGFKLAPDGANCEDLDECLTGTHSCNRATEYCVNENGGFQCVSQGREDPTRPGQCPEGFIFNQRTLKCDDIDECLQQPCPRGKLCVNTPGSYTCTNDQSCSPGFVLHQTTGFCIDVDECSKGLDSCNRTTEICQNSHGSYQCIPKPSRNRDCPAGFKWSTNKDSCEDVDECAEGSHACNSEFQNCANTPGSYRCISKASCPHGYTWTGTKCEDINECLEDIHDCDRRLERCVNTVGSYQCQSIIQDLDQRERCGVGYVFDTNRRACDDINECQLGLHICGESQRCDNTVGSYTCVRVTGCGTGYTLNAASNLCEDDDECALGTHNCGQGFACRNIQGSFRCDRVKCPPGQRLLPDGICRRVSCSPGLEVDSNGHCIDINECARNDVCRTNQRCVNTVGSYKCQNLLNCPPGYELSESGNKCIDVDECSRRLYECGPQQTCRNHPGGYSCACPRGYNLNLLRECEDIDECTRFLSQICSRYSQCINTQGSYVCNCKDGFRKADDDKNCDDVDECAESPNLCQQVCNNVWGSYQCSCRPGFTLAADNRSCHDIDECQTYAGHGELCIGYCVNEPGSFSCSCPSGYRLSPDKRTCQDIDECQEQNVCGGEEEICLNTRGGYKCNRVACPPNYVRDRDHRNRCKKAVQECRYDDTECLNEPKSYSYNYLTFVSNIRIPYSGQLDLFTMRGPRMTVTTVQFNLDFKESRAPAGVPKATREYFNLRRTAYNEAMVSLIKTIQGPQEIELDLVLKMYHNGKFAGKAIAKIFIFVTEHKF